MKSKTKIAFFAFPFGDYEGVRQYLDRQAASGWAFAGQYGLLTARFQSTKRQELRYDVVPAVPRRRPEQLRQEVQRRESQGWSPVDTLWGMDIYQSLPCQEPKPARSAEDYRQWKLLFRNWLGWSLAFLGVTLAALLFLSHAFSVDWATLSQQWYLSDSRGVLCLALPLGGVLALGWVAWLVFCLLRRCRPHAPGKAVFVRLRGLLQALALVLCGVTLAVLWADQVPRLWMRLGLGGLLLLTLLLAPVLSHGDRKRQTLLLGGGVFACLLLAMVLGWTVGPVSYDTYTDGRSWRQSTQLALLRGEDLDLDTAEQEVSAFYREEASLLVCQQSYHEHWSGGLTLEASVYTCRLPGLSHALWRDSISSAAQIDGDTATLAGDGWNQLWYRSGTQVIHLAGTVDWSSDGLGARAAATLLDKG